MRSISREISVAEERGYLDTTLAAPLARWVLVAGSSTVTALASGGVVAVVLALTMIVGIAADTGISLAKLIAGVANVWPLAVFSAGLAVLVAGFLHKSAR